MLTVARLSKISMNDPYFVVVVGAVIDNETPCFEILPVEMCFYNDC